jgi:hypothetical protein
VSASARRRRRKRKLGNSQLLGRSNNSNATLQPYKNFTIHTKKASEQPHTALTKFYVSVVELWLLQARLLQNLRRHLLPPKPLRAAAKLEFYVNLNNTSCAQASIYYNITKSCDNSFRYGFYSFIYAEVVGMAGWLGCRGGSGPSVPCPCTR